METKPKRLQFHNYKQSCGNCGLWLYENDDVVYVPTQGLVNSTYFHTNPEGCQSASERVEAVIMPNSKKGFRNDG